MKLELKNFEFYARLSEETTAFNADLWVNGKKLAEVSNDGHGGCNRVDAVSRDSWGEIHELETYCKTLPPIIGSFGKDYPMDLDYKLSCMVEDAIEFKTSNLTNLI